jgi:hypothetical protein
VRKISATVFMDLVDGQQGSGVAVVSGGTLTVTGRFVSHHNLCLRPFLLSWCSSRARYIIFIFSHSSLFVLRAASGPHICCSVLAPLPSLFVCNSARSCQASYFLVIFTISSSSSPNMDILSKSQTSSVVVSGSDFPRDVKSGIYCVVKVKDAKVIESLPLQVPQAHQIFNREKA